MGSAAHVVVVDAPVRARVDAREALADLESRWSRFLPDSEVSLLNREAGRWVTVSPETYNLVELARAAWVATAGAFDPTVLPAVVAAGYDRSFPETLSAPSPAGRPVPGAGAGLDLDPERRAVRVAPGSGFDPGGIGKGLAADLVVRLLMEEGAAGASVNVGGDLRVAGAAPTAAGWVVGVEDPLGPADRAGGHDRQAGAVPLQVQPPGTGGDLMRLCLQEGAVATSSRLVRSWGDGTRHHLIDPATGAPTGGGVSSVTAVAGEAWWAEVATKAAFVAGAAGALHALEVLGCDGLLVTDSGAVHATAGLEAFRC